MLFLKLKRGNESALRISKETLFLIVLPLMALLLSLQNLVHTIFMWGIASIVRVNMVIYNNVWSLSHEILTMTHLSSVHSCGPPSRDLSTVCEIKTFTCKNVWKCSTKMSQAGGGRHRFVSVRFQTWQSTLASFQIWYRRKIFRLSCFSQVLIISFDNHLVYVFMRSF